MLTCIVALTFVHVARHDCMNIIMHPLRLCRDLQPQFWTISTTIMDMCACPPLLLDIVCLHACLALHVCLNIILRVPMCAVVCYMSSYPVCCSGDMAKPVSAHALVQACDLLAGERAQWAAWPQGQVLRFKPSLLRSESTSLMGFISNKG